jgi:hypothetical protein
MGKIPSKSQNIIPADDCAWNYLEVDERHCFQCRDSCLVSGSQWWIHVPFPVMVLEWNVSGSTSWSTKFSSPNLMLPMLPNWSQHSQNPTRTFNMCRQSQQMTKTGGSDTLHSQEIVRHLQTSLLHNISNFLIYFWSSHLHWPSRVEIIFDGFSITLDLFRPVLNLLFRGCSNITHCQHPFTNDL